MTINFNGLEASLDSSVQKALESFLFLEVVPKLDGSIESGEDFLVEVESFGKEKSRMVIALNRKTAKAIASESPMLSGQELNDEVVRDFWSEIANTIAGRMLAAIQGESSSFDLSIPKCKNEKLVKPESFPMQRLYSVDIGEFRIYFGAASKEGSHAHSKAV